jgi:two-component system OmpR family response regulator
MTKRTKKAKILLVEDDTNLGFVIKDKLLAEEFEVVLCTDGQAAIKSFLNERYDLCILDIMLPIKDGFELAEEIRNFDLEIPIIFLTAKSLTEDKIKGFKLGGDDYITKPFDFEELLLRIDAILSRTQKRNQGTTLSANEFTLGEYQFDSINQTLRIKGEVIKLTKKENNILKLLCLQQDKILTRELTLKSVWGADDYFSGRSMDVFISKLRKHLSQDQSVQIINIHGVGFKLMVEKQR